MSQLERIISDAIILTGDELLAQFHQPYADYRQWREADTAEWMLMIQVWLDERDYYRETCKRAEVLQRIAHGKARKQVQGTYAAFWWKLPVVNTILDMRLMDKVATVETELYLAYCAEEGIPYDVTEWGPPKRLRAANYLGPPGYNPDTQWNRVRDLLEQARMHPKHCFVVPLEVMAALSASQPTVEDVCHASNAGS